MDDALNISASYENDTCTLTVTGTVDLDSADELYRHYDSCVKKLGYRNLIIDFENMGGTSFFDSAGAANLIRILQDTKESGISLKLKHPSENIGQLLGLTGLAGFFDIED